MNKNARILHPALVLALCAILSRAEPLEAAGEEAPGGGSWSTNFATLGSPAGGGIETWTAGTTLSIDASNVNSGGKAIRASGGSIRSTRSRPRSASGASSARGRRTSGTNG
jgi:hypothetical protein